MIKSKTVFVVGAGASAEVNLPVGSKLKTDIAQKLLITRENNGALAMSQDIQSALNFSNDGQNYYKMQEYITACNLIRTAMPLALSIDNFLDTHKDDSNADHPSV